MKEIFDWLEGNKEWIFSGVGAAFLIWILSLLFKKRGEQPIMNQRGGKGSKNSQAGRDINK